MPIHWFGVLLVAVLWGRARVSATTPVRRVLAVALLFQCGLCLYGPARYIPSAKRASAATRLEELLSQAPGPVFFPDRPLAVVRSGQPAHAHSMALSDVERADLDGLAGVDLDEAYRQKSFAAVIVRPTGITSALEENYVAAPKLTELIRSAPFPVTGWHSKLLYAFRPRAERKDPETTD